MGEVLLSSWMRVRPMFIMTHSMSASFIDIPFTVCIIISFVSTVTTGRKHEKSTTVYALMPVQNLFQRVLKIIDEGFQG